MPAKSPKSEVPEAGPSRVEFRADVSALGKSLAALLNLVPRSPRLPIQHHLGR